VWSNQISRCKVFTPLGDGVRGTGDSYHRGVAVQEAASFNQHMPDDGGARQRAFPQQRIRVAVPLAVGELALSRRHDCSAVDLTVTELKIVDCSTGPCKEGKLQGLFLVVGHDA
jgi:hypothetical protein